MNCTTYTDYAIFIYTKKYFKKIALKAITIKEH